METRTSKIELTDKPLDAGKYQGSYLQEVWGNDPDYVLWLGSEAKSFPDAILDEACALWRDYVASSRYLEGQPPVDTYRQTIYVVTGRMVREGMEIREIFTDSTSAVWSAVSLGAFGEDCFDVWEVLQLGHKLRIFQTIPGAIVPPTNWSFREIQQQLNKANEDSPYKTTYKLKRVAKTMAAIVREERRRQNERA